ncbi:MAG TPA: TMEM175 family protein [Acidimicrobiia bacterium]|jgi:uncharacterized membrane protein|nr:TMEM175 family protein [Acidimicrobiia bacterium]
MSTGRLEAFSDGVIAIAITVMVLELKKPDGATWDSLHAVLSGFFTYVLSFVMLGIYWNNHHHMLQLTKRVNGAILWANLHLLFWLSLFPYFTEWMGAHHLAKVPTAAYGVVLLCAAIAFYILMRAIVRDQGPDSVVQARIGRDLKGRLSPVAYALSIPLAFVDRWIAVAIFVGVALVWLIPDRRLESQWSTD